MKILALEKEVPGATVQGFKKHQNDEAIKVWELYQAGVFRELYFRRDWPGAVLILECEGVEEAEAVLGRLPFVKKNLITFDIVPLGPYPGFARLFREEFS